MVKNYAIWWSQTERGGSDIYVKSQTRGRERHEHTDTQTASLFLPLPSWKFVSVRSSGAAPRFSSGRNKKSPVVGGRTLMFHCRWLQFHPEFFFFFRYHATANGSYRWATVPDVSMHYFLRFSCFMEVLTFPEPLFIIAFYRTAMQADNTIKSISWRSGAKTRNLMLLSVATQKLESYKLRPVFHSFRRADTMLRGVGRWLLGHLYNSAMRFIFF